MDPICDAATADDATQATQQVPKTTDEAAGLLALTPTTSISKSGLLNWGSD